MYRKNVALNSSEAGYCVGGYWCFGNLEQLSLLVERLTVGFHINQNFHQVPALLAFRIMKVGKSPMPVAEPHLWYHSFVLLS